MSKQDRMIKKQAAAEQEAGRIIEAAKARATAPKPARKPRTLDPALAALAPEVKAARDAGTAWWRLAHDLGLPGSADSVAKGKAGAGLARRIYATAYGALPPRPVSERTSRKRAEKDPRVKAIRAEKREDRVAAAQAGTGVIPAELPDEEVIAMLKGRTITWTIDLDDLDGKGHSYSSEAATVHPRWARVEFDTADRRCLAFKTLEVLKKMKGDGRFSPGQTRIVRLDRIHTVS